MKNTIVVQWGDGKNADLEEIIEKGRKFRKIGVKGQMHLFWL